MKPNVRINKTGRCLLAIALLGMTVTTAVNAAAPALFGQFELRPLTPTEITQYGLGAAQKSAGIGTLGIGEPAYLEVEVNIAIAPATITNVSWSLTSKPIGSTAVLTNSPLGTNVPIYKTADKTLYQVAGRKMLRPDMAGQYTVVVTVGTSGSGSTNLTKVITAGTFAGIETCTFCHSGGLSAPNKVVPWMSTAHATFFSRAIDGVESSHYSKSCISCHTVGYDTNSLAANGGFDDVAAQYGWTFPAVLTNGNWANMTNNYPQVANLANIQCENCHGPGSQHVFSGGILGNTSAISVNYGAGDCGQCHDATPNHIKNAEWNNAMHAKRWGVTTSTGNNLGANRMACVRCHTAGGFIGYVNNQGNTNAYATNLVFEALTCQTCHEPHSASNASQLRTGNTITLGEGTTVTNAGLGGFCMNCHQSRNGSVTNSLTKYPLGQVTWNGGSSFGPHDSPQGDMLEGLNAVTYGKAIPSSAHKHSITNTCVDCHMQTVATTDPAFAQAGGHTFHMSYNVVTNGTTNSFDKVDVCVQCHGPITSFDMVKQDYNGDGVTEGVQTEVHHLLDKLSQFLPNSSGVVDGLVKTPAAKTNYSQQFLKGIYNWLFVETDGSLGVHNASYAVGLLKASITDLTGDTSGNGLLTTDEMNYYIWAVQYFGSATVSNANPNASPAGDGVPNWVKFSMGLNPTVPGTTNGMGGVVWANGKALGGNNSTNTVAIYTAAEVAFNTSAGSTYYIQACNDLSKTWSTVSPAIPGTGAAVSYLTQTRTNLHQFFRVSHTTP